MSDLYVKPSAGRLDARQNSTDYDHPQETNLLNIHRAMDYSAAGEPLLRVNNVGGVTYNDVGNISASLDAFGRLRVSQPFTLFDGALRFRDDPFRWSQKDTG